MEDPLELADIAILMLDLFYLVDVDVEKAVTAKLEINKAREWRKQDNGALSHL